MRIKVGTFNLNNLFSRYNFKASISEIETGKKQVLYTFDSEELFNIKHFQGRLIKPKSYKETIAIAERIMAMDLDVVCVQEVEEIGILKSFNKDYLGSKKYPYTVLFDGNDPRFIDVGLLSRYPVGPITSWKETRAKGESREVFSRDLLQVEILNQTRSRKLFTLFNTHLKSNFISHTVKDPETQTLKNGERRKQQAASIADIIKAVTRPDSSYLLVGDMNDHCESEFLLPFTADEELGLTNALTDMVETGKMNNTKYPPANHHWTHRYSPQSGVYHYNLYDQIWISPALQKK